MQLACVAFGNPLVNISWSREGNPRITVNEQQIEEGGFVFYQSILQICSTEINDTGVYSCLATNALGNDTASFELFVTSELHSK